jgi:hypothetical protein
VFRQARIEEDRGGTPPTALPEARASEPERDAAMSLVIECWQTCDADRPRELVPVKLGFATMRGEIPYASIRAWAQDAGIDGEDVLLVAQVIRSLDVDRTERILSQLTSQG